MDPTALAQDQKKAADEGRTLVFIDESAFFLAPLATYSWSPRGGSLRIKGQLRRQHLSAIGALTNDGRLFLQVHRHACHSREVILFLRHLLHHITGPMLVLWDGGKIHDSAEVREFLALDTIERVVFERFPPYAPEVDPQEFVWRRMKYDVLINRTKYTLDQLELHVRTVVHQLRRRVQLLRNFIKHAGLDL